MEARKLSQSEVSRLTGVKQSTLSKILSGQRVPQGETLEKLSKGLGVNFIEGKNYEGVIREMEVLGVTPELLSEIIELIRKIKRGTP